MLGQAVVVLVWGQGTETAGVGWTWRATKHGGTHSCPCSSRRSLITNHQAGGTLREKQAVGCLHSSRTDAGETLHVIIVLQEPVGLPQAFKSKERDPSFPHAHLLLAPLRAPWPTPYQTYNKKAPISPAVAAELPTL